MIIYIDLIRLFVPRFTLTEVFKLCKVANPTVRLRAHYDVITTCIIQNRRHDEAHSAVGSTSAVQQWRMLDLPFSGLAVARQSLQLAFHIVDYRMHVLAIIWS